MKDHNIARQEQKIDWQQQRVRNIGFNLFVLRLLLFGQLRSLKLVTANLIILDSLLVHLFCQKLHLLWMAILQDRNRKLSDNNKGSEILASELFQAFFFLFLLLFGHFSSLKIPRVQEWMAWLFLWEIAYNFIKSWGEKERQKSCRSKLVHSTNHGSLQGYAT